MRAVWIASVANIDWPSKKNLTPKEQRLEMTTMLDEFVKKKKSEIPEKYTDFKTTPLQFTIEPGENDKKIELED